MAYIPAKLGPFLSDKIEETEVCFHGLNIFDYLIRSGKNQYFHALSCIESRAKQTWLSFHINQAYAIALLRIHFAYHLISL